MSEPRLGPMFFNAKGLELEQLQGFGAGFVEWQQGIMWWIGDCARYAESRWPDTWQQAFPPVSPGLISRAMAVAKAYPTEESRNPLATWSIHMREANRPDRIERVQNHVDKGRTSDEARKANSGEGKTRWLLAVDVHYFLHRFWHSGAGVEAANEVSRWIQRTVKRLQDKGLTDVACCFDSKTNHRKELTAEWEDKYKPRPPKEFELVQQLTLVRELLGKEGFCCVLVEGMEADDVMASYAKQFEGRVTLFTQDKDARQCLSEKCNILLDVEWTEDETSGDHLPDYKWMSAKKHTESTGIRPNQWCDFQSLMGDNVDGISGADGIGKKGATDLVKEFGTVEAAIEAARNDSPDDSPWKEHQGPRGGKGWKHAETGEIKKGDKRPDDRSATWKALLEFEPKLEVTRKLVTLRDDLTLPANTRI